MRALWETRERNQLTRGKPVNDHVQNGLSHVTESKETSESHRARISQRSQRQPHIISTKVSLTHLINYVELL